MTESTQKRKLPHAVGLKETGHLSPLAVSFPAASLLLP